MSSFALHIPHVEMPKAVTAVPASVKRSGRIATASSRKAMFHSIRYVSALPWTVFCSIVTSCVPDDFYDWEDESVALFLGEDLSEGSYQI
jgi:hypothetical protein